MSEADQQAAASMTSGRKEHSQVKLHAVLPPSTAA